MILKVGKWFIYESVSNNRYNELVKSLQAYLKLQLPFAKLPKFT